jgi:hypothetical protein
MNTTSGKKAVCLAVIIVGVIFIASFASPTHDVLANVLHSRLRSSQEETIMTEVGTRDIQLL